MRLATGAAVQTRQFCLRAQRWMDRRSSSTPLTPSFLRRANVRSYLRQRTCIDHLRLQAQNVQVAYVASIPYTEFPNFEAARPAAGS